MRVQSLLDALWSYDQCTRLNAAEEIGALGPEGADAVPALVLVMGDDNSEVIAKAKEAIRNIGAAAVPALLGILEDPRSPAFRHYAADFVDENEFRSFAAEALSELGELGVPYLMRALEDKDPAVREAAIEIIPRIGAAAAAAVPVLGKYLEDPNWADPAAISLAAIASAATQPEQSEAFSLLSTALRHKDPKIRRLILAAFAFIGDNVGIVLPLLADATRDSDAAVRKGAIEMLERLQQRRNGRTS